MPRLCSYAAYYFCGKPFVSHLIVRSTGIDRYELPLSVNAAYESGVLELAPR